MIIIYMFIRDICANHSDVTRRHPKFRPNPRKPRVFGIGRVLYMCCTWQTLGPPNMAEIYKGSGDSISTCVTSVFWAMGNFQLASAEGLWAGKYLLHVEETAVLKGIPTRTDHICLETETSVNWFSWMIPNLCIKTGCFTKHPSKNGCLGFQVYTYTVFPLSWSFPPLIGMILRSREILSSNRPPFF